jgi:Cytochrome P460
VTQVPVSLAPIYRANAEEVLKASDDLRHVPRYATYPRGAIIRKENRGKDGKLISVSEMIREHNDAVAGRDPWWYRQYDAHGTLQYEGNAADARVQQECAACHRGAADRDFLFHSYLTAQAE